MTELAQIFEELSISQYLDTFVEQGFDTWETILDITESDFDALGVKLGHRRKIQRRIADSRGISTERALASPAPHTLFPDDRQQFSEDQKTSRTKGEGKYPSSSGGKRKYRRHPKPDENAPERPPSAYVIFSNKIREDLKEQQLSFTEIAKLVGENWQNLPPSEKEPFESQAFLLKDTYNNELAEYKKTENYRNYQVYLAEFKAKQSSNQQDADAAKRPKLENRVSNDSSGNGSSSATSQAGGDTPVSRKRVHSGTSNTNMPWLGSRNTPAPPSSSISNSANLIPFSGPVGVKMRTSPVAKSPRTLPGYRDSLNAHPPIRDTPHGSYDPEGSPFLQLSPRTLPGYRDSLNPPPPIRDTSNDKDGTSFTLPHRQHSQPHSSGANSQMSRNRSNEPQRGSFGTISGQPPPLTHDSTVESASSGSSGPLFTPRTPLDMEHRNPQFPNLFLSKAPGFMDSHQLPPLRPPSLSPQSSASAAYHSPQGTVDYSGQTQALHALRNYQHTSNQNQQATYMSPVSDAAVTTQQHGTSTYVDDGGGMDPVSALLRAGEIVDRNDQNRQQQQQTQHPTE